MSLSQYIYDAIVRKIHTAAKAVSGVVLKRSVEQEKKRNNISNK